MKGNKDGRNLVGAFVLNVLSALLSSAASTNAPPLEFPPYDGTEAHARTPEADPVVYLDPETDRNDLS